MVVETVVKVVVMIDRGKTIAWIALSKVES